MKTMIFYKATTDLEKLFTHWRSLGKAVANADCSGFFQSRENYLYYASETGSCLSLKRIGDHWRLELEDFGWNQKELGEAIIQRLSRIKPAFKA